MKIALIDSKGAFYTKRCANAEDFYEFSGMLYSSSKPGWSLLSAIPCPVRTENGRDFSKDFFLPIFVNFALKIDNIALKILGSLLAITFDLITFPIRLVAAPFRVLYNHAHPKEPHLLVRNLYVSETFKGDYITIECSYERNFGIETRSYLMRFPCYLNATPGTTIQNEIYEVTNETGLKLLSTQSLKKGEAITPNIS